MPGRNFFYCLLFIVFAALAVMAWWPSPWMLIAGIIVLLVGKHALMPIRKELLWFVVSGIMGASTESVIMYAGPWRYSQSGIMNFPVWLPFLWGLAGTIGISLYQSIAEPKSKARLTKGTKRG